MRQVLVLLLVATGVVAGAWWVDHLAGDLTMHIGSLTVQTPISFAVVAVLAFSVALYWLYRLVGVVFGLGHLVRRSGERGGRRRGEQAVTATLVALAAREGADAKRAAAQARRYLGDTPQTLMLSAYAAGVAGDVDGANEAFEKLAARKDAAFLGLRGLLSQAVAAEDWTRANELAKQAERVHPGTAWMRAERTQFAVRTGDWQEALLLNRDDTPHASLAAAAAEAESDPGKAMKLARDAHKRDPSLAPATLAYARRLRDAGKEKAAQDVLRKSWARAPQPGLAQFALAPAVDRLQRLKDGQALVRDAPESAESHMLLGRLCLEAGIPGEAKHHAEAAERAGLKQRRLYILQADIAGAFGDDEAHQAEFRAAHQRAATAEPDPGWVCAACNTLHAQWHPACPVCHSAGRIMWRAPGFAAVAVG